MNQIPTRSELVSLPGESIRCHLKAERLNAARRCSAVPQLQATLSPLPLLSLLVCNQLAAKLYA